ncbi:MAG: hypothetical protein R3F11_04620 [Verrucomicrobiales bacterium]
MCPFAEFLWGAILALILIFIVIVIPLFLIFWEAILDFIFDLYTRVPALTLPKKSADKAPGEGESSEG